MSRETEPLKIEKKIVITFDICSSTSILEDLHKTENIDKWRDFLIWMKNYLKLSSDRLNFNMYKFTGDGWILLFDYNYSGQVLLNFLQDFCLQFKTRYKRKIEDYLDTQPAQIGITFGIDRGSLIKFVMNEQIEYVGRTINVACRLQGAIKDRDKSPQYKALITKHLFHEILDSIENLDYMRVKRKLRNINDDKDILCIKLNLM
jgi:hypothetical protein